MKCVFHIILAVKVTIIIMMSKRKNHFVDINIASCNFLVITCHYNLDSRTVSQLVRYRLPTSENNASSR